MIFIKSDPKNKSFYLIFFSVINEDNEFENLLNRNNNKINQQQHLWRKQNNSLIINNNNPNLINNNNPTLVVKKPPLPKKPSVIITRKVNCTQRESTTNTRVWYRESELANNNCTSVHNSPSPPSESKSADYSSTANCSLTTDHSSSSIGSRLAVHSISSVSSKSTDYSISAVDHKSADYSKSAVEPRAGVFQSKGEDLGHRESFNEDQR